MVKILQFVDLFLVLFIIYLFAEFVINSLAKKIDMMGNPPINRFLFIIGKAANFSCWGIFIFMLIRSLFVRNHQPIALLVLSSISLIISAIMIFLSFRHLGDMNKFGLPSEKTSIVDTGVYSVSRNPMYAGFYLLNIASALFYPHPANIVLAATGIVIHHFIVLGEEKFMESAFGQEWPRYRGKVRRYF